MKYQRLLIAALLISSPISSFCQDYYFSTNQSQISTYQQYDAAGNMIGHYNEKIISIVGDITNGSIVFDQNYFDKDGKGAFKGGSLFKLKIAISDGELKAHIESISKALAVQSLMAKGNVVALPSNMRAGDKIDDSKISIMLGKTKGRITLKNRKVVALEKISTPAGTFDSFKVSETQSTKVMIISSEVEIVSWFVKGVGCVKQQVFDHKGKLQSWLQLVSIEHTTN